MAIFYSPHYSAPVTCVILALMLLAIKRVRQSSRPGLFLMRAVFAACVGAFVIERSRRALAYSLQSLQHLYLV